MIYQQFQARLAALVVLSLTLAYCLSTGYQALAYAQQTSEDATSGPLVLMPSLSGPMLPG